MDGKILTAIVDIRNQKKRPSRDAIFDIITKTNSCNLEEFNEAFDAMESNGLIENRGTAKNESYYDMAHFFGALNNPFWQNWLQKGKTLGMMLRTSNNTYILNLSL